MESLIITWQKKSGKIEDTHNRLLLMTDLRSRFINTQHYKSEFETWKDVNQAQKV